ncbi:MAG: hypothetical protein ACTTKN_11575 [Phocaeicola sp.]|uniref:hypothetical protein n=1 Tax=Phocaeicola sp. TaxID=2773926 RepID=UPI003FA08C52
MVKIVQKINRELFIGYDNDCWEEVFTVNDMKIRLFDIYNNPLRNLKSKISIDDFNAIVQSERLKLDSLICDSYRTSEGLNTYFLLDKNDIYIFSFGELQPTKVVLNVESHWQTI